MTCRLVIPDLLPGTLYYIRCCIDCQDSLLKGLDGGIFRSISSWTLPSEDGSDPVPDGGVHSGSGSATPLHSRPATAHSSLVPPVLMTNSTASCYRLPTLAR